MDLEEFKNNSKIQNCPFCKTALSFRDKSHPGRAVGLYSAGCTNTLPCSNAFCLMADDDGTIIYYEIDVWLDGLQYNLECSNFIQPKTKVSKWFYEDVDGDYKKSFYLASPFIEVAVFYQPEDNRDFYTNLVKKLKDLVVFS